MKAALWRLRRPIPAGPIPWGPLMRAWDLGEAAARLTWLRGVDRPEDLAWRLDPAWSRTHDPHLLEGMGAAVARIRQAVAAGEGICVYGDYDADGVTASALLVRVLERMGAKAHSFIPNRFSDGYGLHLDCIQELMATLRPGLFISVDCGVQSLREVQATRELGADWIITDHHTPGPEWPEAVAVIHPLHGSYPEPCLSGVGVAFKLAQALLDAVPHPTERDSAFLDGLLKLVALGTVADQVPLQGENALLVKRGLAALGQGNGPGLQALLDTAKVEFPVTAQSIAFNLAPRINAAGRMGGAEDAVRLLLARDVQAARRHAQSLDCCNAERRELQNQLLAGLPEPDEAAFDLQVQPEAHKGVIGIVAGQRMRLTGRPTGVCCVQEGVVHGSLRAPEGYDLNDLLTLARPFLRSGGGHRAAAGISFELPNLAFVRRALEQGAREQRERLGPQPLLVDGNGWEEIPDAQELLRLEPFGQGFPVPVLAIRDARPESVRTFGNGHLRFSLEGVPEPIVGFGMDPAELPATRTFHLAAGPLDHPRFGRQWRFESLLGEEVPA